MQSDQFQETPEALGIDPTALAALLERVQVEVEEGLLPSAQVAIARHGKLAAFASYGDATNDSLYCVFSATKAITSVAAWSLIEEGRLDISRKVIDLVPEFAPNGKDGIIIEQLFTHTAGFPHAPFRVTDWLDKEKRHERYANWTLNWAPGSRFEYHPTSSMWVIAEIIERISGMAFTDFVRQRIAEPLGLPDLWVGCPVTEHHRISPISHVGDPMTSEDYAKLGLPEPPVTEVTEAALTAFNEPEERLVGVPGGGGIMSAAELALFYQALLGYTSSGKPLLKEDTIKQGLAVRTGDLIDPMSGVPVNRALGLVIAGDKKRNLRGFGHTNSALAFGHAGAGGQIGWADPATGLSLGYCTNGHDRHPFRQGRRGISISNRASQCVLQTP